MKLRFAISDLHSKVVIYLGILLSLFLPFHTDISLAKDDLILPNIEETIARFTASDASIREPAILEIYDALFQYSYDTAPEIIIARSTYTQKVEELYTAKAKRYSPALDGQLSQIHEFESIDDTSSDDGDDEDEERDISEARLNLELPLFRKPLSVSLELAGAEENVARNNLNIALYELDLELKELLGNYLDATYRLFNIGNSVRLSKEHVKRIERGYELRDQTKLQLLRAQANLKDLEIQLDLDEQNKDVAFRAILDFTGLEENSSIFNELKELLVDEIRTAGCINTLAAIDENYPQIEQFAENSETPQLFTFFRDNSLLYQRIVLEKQESSSRAQQFTQDEWFDVYLRGYYGYQDDSELSDSDTEAAMSLVFSVPIFTGGTLFSTKASKAAALQVADTKKIADVRAQFHSLLNTKKFIAQLRKVRQKQQLNLRQQQEIVVLSLKSYQIKQTSMQDLLTSQNKLIAVKNALMQTTTRLGIFVRQFAWQLGVPYPAPASVELDLQ